MLVVNGMFNYNKVTQLMGDKPISNDNSVVETEREICIRELREYVNKHEDEIAPLLAKLTEEMEKREWEQRRKSCQ